MIRQIAHSVRSGRRSAAAIASDAIARIRERDAGVGAVTRLLEERALADAAAVDVKIAQGEDPGPLAGVPFGVKDLFDVAGIATTAGSAMRRNRPPAAKDAEAISRLQAAGAVLVATLNMDELAYGFATVNAFYGTTRNPHDRNRLAGGSSGGSAAAVAAGLLPFTLGSDTNGSIRIPAALCGVYGLKPTHGSLPMEGVVPFVDSFDDIGPMTGSLDDLQLIYEILRGGKIDAGSPELLKVGRLGGWFTRNLSADMADTLDRIALALAADEVEFPEVAAARSAAFVMTAVEGGTLHLPDLCQRALDFDPATRDRLIAGAMVPASAYRDAERFRAWFRAQVATIFDRFDVLIAPVTGDVAPRIDHPFVEVDGALMPARSHLGLFTQPLSFIGLPVLAVPLARPGSLSLGIQLIAAPGGEARLFALARRFVEDGLIDAQMLHSGDLSYEAARC
jgi:AtzE family amidohydrolase